MLITAKTARFRPSVNAKQAAKSGNFMAKVLLAKHLRELFGGIAQLVEHLPCKQGVSGSNPLTSTKT